MTILPIEIDWEFVGSGGQPDLKTQIIAEKSFRTFRKMFNDDLNKLIAKLEDLKDQESEGKNPKAFEAAKNQLSAWNNKTKEDLDDLKDTIRKELKKDKTIGKTAVVSRSKFREFKLARGAFDGGAESEKYVYIYQFTSKSLVDLSTEIAKQNAEERKLRSELIDVIELLNTEKDKSGNQKKIVRNANEAIKNYLPQIKKYQININEMKTKIEKANKLLTKDTPIEKKETNNIKACLKKMTSCCENIEPSLNRRLTSVESLEINILDQTAFDVIKDVRQNIDDTNKLQKICEALQGIAKRAG